jgi:ribosomal protein L7/L12
MSDNILLSITKEEKSILVYALEVLRSEYLRVSETLANAVMADGFARNASDAARLVDKIREPEIFVSQASLDAGIIDFLKQGLKIDAIRYVRTYRLLSLKEAKDYVDDIQAKNGL